MKCEIFLSIITPVLAKFKYLNVWAIFPSNRANIGQDVDNDNANNITYHFFVLQREIVKNSPWKVYIKKKTNFDIIYFNYRHIF